MAETKLDDQTLISISTRYKEEAKQAKQSRMEQNKINFDAYHMRQDFSYKQKGQSREFLPKMAMAVEQDANYIQQGLIDMGDWFKVYPEEGLLEDAMRVKPSDIYILTNRYLEKDGFLNKVGEAMKLGLIGSLMIAKVSGKYTCKPRYKVKDELKNGTFGKKLYRVEDKAWELSISLIRQEDFYLDPTGRGLYVAEDMYMDYYEVESLAKNYKLYDLKAVQELKASMSNESPDKAHDKSRETGQNVTNHGFRNQVKLTEYWGNVVSPEGELLQENVTWTVANDRIVIQKPRENPNWHGEHPYVSAPVIRVPHSVWGKALMDGPTMLNMALNEMFNLGLDAGLMGVHGIKQIHEHWLEDASQVADGIGAGDTLRANTSCPPGMKVLETVSTSSFPPEFMNVYNLVNQEFNTASLTNDLRMGVAPFRQVKATEVVEASQSITSMFSGIAKQIESGWLKLILEKSWKNIAQHIEIMDEDVMKSLLGAKKATELLGLSNQELFAETVQGCKFEVFGISATLNKQKDFTKLQAMLQTIAASPILMEEFNKKYSFPKLLTEIMRSLDINTAKIEADKSEGGDLTQAPGSPMDAEQGLPNEQSQIPQAGAAGNQGDLTPESAIPASSFPPSRATPAAG